MIGTVAAGDPEDIVVTARAGSGKTTTMIEAIKARPHGKTVTMCAFNRSIAAELRTRTRGFGAVTAKTLHSIGKTTIEARFGFVTVEANRERALAVDVCGESEPNLVLDAVAELAGLAKECDPDNATDIEAIRVVGQSMGALPSEEELDGVQWGVNGVLRAAAAVVTRSVDIEHDRRMSHSDMLYVPLALKLRPERSDLVVVDEAQDMNLAQLRLASRVRAQGGRFIVVGDNRQSIYSWRGAAPGSLERVRDGLKAREMKLTVTYRCARRIVAEAQRIVPDLEAAPGAVDGEVRTVRWDQLADGARPGDFVIGRTNAILVLACLRILRAGTRAAIVGSDLGKAMHALVKRFARAVHGDMPSLAVRIDMWRDAEVKKAQARRSENAETMAKDKAAVLQAILDECDTADEMLEKIEALFVEDGSDRVMCSTVHKAKGLEADRVWMLCDSFDAVRPPKTPVLAIEEQNLRYVTITRARQELVYVRDAPSPRST